MNNISPISLPVVTGKAKVKMSGNLLKNPNGDGKYEALICVTNGFLKLQLFYVARIIIIIIKNMLFN